MTASDWRDYLGVIIILVCVVAVAEPICERVMRALVDFTRRSESQRDDEHNEEER